MQKSLNVKHKVLAISLITVMASMFLAGCQGAGAPSKSADQVIKDGIKKLTEITSYSYMVSTKGDLKDQEAKEMKFDLTAGGQVDVKDPKDPKVTLMLSGSASDGKDMGGDGALELRLNKEALHFNVSKFTLLAGAGEVPKEISDMFGKWWKITLPAGTTDELAKSVPQGDEANLTPEQLKVKQVLESTNFFGEPKYVGTENVKGEDSYHYSVTLDKKAFIAFIKAVSEAQGQTISDTELADAQTSMDKVDVSGDLYVGTTSGVLNQFVGSLKFTAKEASDPAGTVSVTLTLWDINKPVTLQVPTDSTEFPVEQFFGPMMSGGATTGTEELGGATSLTDMGSLDIPTEQGTPTVQ